MSLFDDLLPPRYVPPPEKAKPKSRAKLRTCRECGDRTMRASDRCAACAAAEYRMSGDRLPAQCWCESTSVWVRREAIKAGITRSCGLPECAPLAA